ncbi:HD domain-containing phosphohydrolase [Synechococcus sp. CS-1328]|uniref:HD domain-containing phosphohydrolase n=1 Tax=Synechococcus sp. CS-1328 TaxID=2847976 RepID=UPI00223AD1F0|nr:HD domain-containing phosphohydrolase [Synechococcus sp. CS-1328]MCT0226563.1 HD domain-containing protein [Synechococcus sp. CS-1328]
MLGPLDLVIVEDSDLDFELMGDALKAAGLEVSLRRADNEAGFRAALEWGMPEAILADWSLPNFSGSRALEIAQSLCPDVPFLFVSGTVSESMAFEGLGRGAVDFVYKHEMEKLGPALGRAVRETRSKQALVESEERYRCLFESAMDGILILNGDTGRITQANPKISTLLGFDLHELIDKQLWEIGVFNDKEKAIESFVRLQQNGFNHYDDLPLVTSDGRQKEVEFVSNFYLEGNQRMIQCTIRDLSEQRANQRQMMQYKAETLQSLEEMVAALVAINEARDPYTAGHETRVATLACEMAREMGLESQQIEGIRISGLVHDIGKFTIPSEILTKPTRLSPQEYALLQTHVQAGYDALKPIHFPWPVAEAVLHHHERLDGSGYPNGLKGDAISLEGRILAVADTLEAMSTNRPYRFSPGIEKALDTIEAGKHQLFDPAVVEACLRLYREQHRSLPLVGPA